MKKNSVLYILLLVLIITNGFFLFNYLERPNHKNPKDSGNFITKELNFNDSQLIQFKTLEDKHHNKMRAIGDGVKLFKDELFEQITASSVNQIKVDSLIALISEKDKLKEKELFKRLRSVYELCDETQKERFSEIIKKARKFDGQRPKKGKSKD